MIRISKKTPFVIFFGGPGREEIIQTRVSLGIEITGILIEIQQNKKFLTSYEKIQSMQIPIFSSVDELVTLLGSKIENQVLFSIGYPKLIPNRILDMFKLAINIHPTLLPKYKGPTSGYYILLNNEKQSGSTIHLMTEEADGGAILLQNEFKISKFDTKKSLQKKTYEQEPDLVRQLILDLTSKGIQPFSVVGEEGNESFPRRYPEDSQIDPNKSLLQNFDAIRASDPENYPAFFFVDGKKIYIYLRSESPENEESL